MILNKKFRNRVVSEIRSSKIHYYNYYFVEHQSNMKMLWTGIRSIINIKSKQFYNTSQLAQNDEIVQNSKEISDIFNNYLLTLLAKLIQKFQEQLNHHSHISMISWKTHFYFSYKFC